MRDRLARGENRHDLHAHLVACDAERGQQRDDLSVARRGAEPRHGVLHAAHARCGHEREPGHLRAGSMDHPADDAEPRRPLRLPQRDGAGAAYRPGTERADAKCRLSRDPERAELEERVATPWCVLRSVRQRQDRDEGEHRPVHGGAKSRPSPASPIRRRPSSTARHANGWTATTISFPQPAELGALSLSALAPVSRTRRMATTS